MSGIVTKLWRGQYPLPMAFLGFYIFGSWIVLFIVFIVMGIVAQFEPLFMPGFVLSLAMLAAYWFVASIGVWRSATTSIASDNWVSRVEAWLARAMVVLLGAYGVWSLLNYGVGTVMPEASAPT